MPNSINARITSFRKQMRNLKLDAYIIPSSDEHQSEYVCDRSKVRAWISGFDGSAGTAVITSDHAGLWTDSRYFLQAEEQLVDNEFQLHKIIKQGTPEFITWLCDNLPKNSIVGCDGLLFSKSQIEKYEKILAQADIQLKSSVDFIDEIWDDRPSLPSAKIYEHDVFYTGEPRETRLNMLRSKFQEDADGYLLTALDDIAWLFTLRGADVESNPVFLSYAIVQKSNAILFVESSKISEEIQSRLIKDNVKLAPYESILAYLNNLDKNYVLHVSASDISMSMCKAINGKIHSGENYIRTAKGIKNSTEIGHIKRVMEKDGVALTRMYMWLEETLKSRKVKESEVRDMLIKYRSEQEGYIGESFGAIVGYKSNGAIIHYSPQESTCAEISNDGMLLVDSGGQFLDGTTDTTRTIHLGTPTVEEKKAFTLVLKGYISLDLAKFPHGTHGIQLDTLARMHLWEQGMNYGHGTGHGVGFLLNVHEAPQGYAPIWGARSKTVLQPGMVTSNEPGFYKVGGFGIRIENLLLTVEDEKNEYGNFLSHETLTLFPIEIKLIDETLMTARENAWFNRYHAEVYKRLSPHLDDHEQKWLRMKCRPLN